MKKRETGLDYEFSYTDKDLFEGGPGKEWCPLFGELPTIFITRKKHQVADRCVDIIIAARNLWDFPYPYFQTGTFLTPEQLALSNPNWPDPEEITGFEAAIIAARSICWWNHFHIVTNARDYCRNGQVPLPNHWYENDAGILHYARSSMHHFTQPSGTGNEYCPLLRYPPGSPEEAELIKYERNLVIQEEAQKIPDNLVFSALAIAEAWDILIDVLYYGEHEKSSDVQHNLRVANKFLEKAERLNIEYLKKNLEDTEREIDNLKPEALGYQKIKATQQAGRKTAVDEKKKKAKKKHDKWQKEATTIWNSFPSLGNIRVAEVIVKNYKKERLRIKLDPNLDNDGRNEKIDDLDFYFKKATVDTIRKIIVKPSLRPAR